MKGVNPTTGGWKSFQETRVTKPNETLKTAWMTDLKKAGERVEGLWCKGNALQQSRRAEKY
jgi:hypothetical protein